jgi:chorismate lyase/3-hydroxybenzoate synthase
LPLEPPSWVQALLPLTASHRGDGIDAATRGELLRLRTCLPNARQMDADRLAARVRDAYLELADRLRRAGRHPIRVWNFVPGIGDRYGDLDRYMVFNRGRFEALAKIAAPSLPTSSAIGVEGDDLVIEVVAAGAPGVPVENPRQISSWKYSPCYGPRPPCFARATVAPFEGRRWLLIGGTASIVGEDSCHPERVDAQLEETFANLCALIESVTPRGSDPLAMFEDVRVYIARAAHAQTIADSVQRRFAGAREIECALATVCRPELLVEIEGRVGLTPRPA